MTRVADDFTAIARRMEELRFEKETAKKPVPAVRCSHCRGHGWVRSVHTREWNMCSWCGNTHGKFRPIEEV